MCQDNKILSPLLIGKFSIFKNKRNFFTPKDAFNSKLSLHGVAQCIYCNDTHFPSSNAINGFFIQIITQKLKWRSEYATLTMEVQVLKKQISTSFIQILMLSYKLVSKSDILTINDNARWRERPRFTLAKIKNKKRCACR